MTIELRIVFLEDEETDPPITHAPCVPYIDSLIETSWGTRQVRRLRYDFNETSGFCRVWVYVGATGAR
jgi:hypothetical protein